MSNLKGEIKGFDMKLFVDIARFSSIDSTSFGKFFKVVSLSKISSSFLFY